MASVEAKIRKEKWKAKALKEMKTEGDWKNTGIKTGIEMLLSVLVGGAIGSTIGKPSLVLGLATTAFGHYTGVNWLPPIGIGMMASSNPLGTKQPTVSGFDIKTEVQNAKDRLVGFKDSLLQRTYLDKIIKPTGNSGSGETTNGFGSVGDNNDALRQVEDQLVRSAIEFKRERGESTSGLEEEMQGTNEPDFSGM